VTKKGVDQDNMVLSIIIILLCYETDQNSDLDNQISWWMRWNLQSS